MIIHVREECVCIEWEKWKGGGIESVESESVCARVCACVRVRARACAGVCERRTLQRQAREK